MEVSDDDIREMLIQARHRKDQHTNSLMPDSQNAEIRLAQKMYQKQVQKCNQLIACLEELLQLRMARG